MGKVWFTYLLLRTGKRGVPHSTFAQDVGDPGWSLSDLTGRAFTSQMQSTASSPLFGEPKWMDFGTHSEKHSSDMSINFDKKSITVLGDRTIEKILAQMPRGGEGRK